MTTKVWVLNTGPSDIIINANATLKDGEAAAFYITNTQSLVVVEQGAVIQPPPPPPPPPNPGTGTGTPQTPYEHNDPMAFYCAEAWRHVDGRAADRWNANLYSSNEIAYFESGQNVGYNQTAKAIAQYVVAGDFNLADPSHPIRDTSAATLKAMAISNARSEMSDTLMAWALGYDGHYYDAVGVKHLDP